MDILAYIDKYRWIFKYKISVKWKLIKIYKNLWKRLKKNNNKRGIYIYIYIKKIIKFYNKIETYLKYTNKYNPTVACRWAVRPSQTPKIWSSCLYKDLQINLNENGFLIFKAFTQQTPFFLLHLFINCLICALSPSANKVQTNHGSCGRRSSFCCHRPLVWQVGLHWFARLCTPTMGVL